jgi:hypothetical protein
MEYIYEYFLEIVECDFARNGLTNWKTFFTNILKNIIWHHFAGESHQVVKITVPYGTGVLRRQFMSWQDTAEPPGKMQSVLGRHRVSWKDTGCPRKTQGVLERHRVSWEGTGCPGKTQDVLRRYRVKIHRMSWKGTRSPEKVQGVLERQRES